VPPDAWADLDSEHTVEAICEALREEGHRASFLEANVEAVDRLRASRPDICFNIAEGHHGESREAQMPALLDLLGIPYTGSRVRTQAVTLDKALTKRIWQSAGLRTSPFQSFYDGHEPLNTSLEFPLFVKPSREGTGMGISGRSIVKDEYELRQQLDYVINAYKQPALAEHFLSGQELTVGVIGNQPQQYAFPPIGIETEDVAPQERGVYGHYVKTETGKIMHTAKLEPEFLDVVRKMAIEAHNVVGALDVSRVDIRCDNQGTPYLLEINTTPGLSPGFSDLAVAADEIKMGYVWLINTILNLACKRYDLKAPDPVLPL